ncbi:MAG TPA: NAD-dependent epimerase/dehydratase family protein [Baekduia sp.]|uniref:NAD-dependent epimerase/dehydratase family protein n=1 Tax=Baekduia sp. TaxID=2600305 RepID=UPI002D78AB21|nr:NAD-dependent epimerase/dehydratase family protein [Baekduia sp.]HET6508389.1 NAD-dependent epimerase/dehydratase family protein [Baekduia sp.]
MGVTLVTGATGLIGSHVARALVERGDRVRVAVPEGASRAALAGIEDGVQVFAGDVVVRRDARRALRDVDLLFHVAGATTLRAGWRALHRANVLDTRVVLEEALRAGVERVVHTSAVAAIGPAPRGVTADETQGFNAARVGLTYANAKAEAEREALRICAQGLPVVIVNPAHVLGRGDVHRSSTELVRRFLRREIPIYVDGTLCIVGAEDVARGHLLAAERGAVGERYILGGRNFTNDRLFADLGRLSGVEPPAVKLPLPAALAVAQAFQALPGRPPITVEEVRALSLRWAYRSNKARRELGWTTGHHEQPLIDTIEWYREREPDAVRAPGTRQPLALRVAGFGTSRLAGVARALRD